MALASVFIEVRHTGFVRDDWNHYYNMRKLHELPFTDALWRLATNDWFGAHEIRIFFGSFLTHYLVSPLGANASGVAYTLILVMHAGTALLVALIIQRLTRQQLAGVATGALLLVMPITVSQALWINNMFFVQPLFLLSVLALIGTTPSIPAAPRALMISVTAIASQFSGEAIFPVLYSTLVLLAIAAFRRGSREGLWSLLPLCLSTLTLGIYLAQIVSRPMSQNLNPPSLDAVREYFSQFGSLAYDLLDFGSGVYGVGGINLSVLALVGAILLLGLAAAAVSLATWHGTAGKGWPLIASMGALLVSSALPMVLGMLSGDRPTPDYRYLYVPACISTVLVTVVLWTVVRHFRRGQSGFRIAVLVAVAYFTLVTMHNVVDVWGLQRSIDARIWGKVDPFLTDGVDAIVTYHPDHQYVMAPRASGAISDFQADWGINGKLQWEADASAARPIFQDARLFADGTVAALGYFGGEVVCLPAGSRVLYLALNYGEKFSQFLSDPLLTSDSYRDFAAFRETMRPYETVVKPWPKYYCGSSS